MTDKKCPRCGLWNTDSAIRCDCGHDFVKTTAQEALALRHSEAVQTGARNMSYGALLFIGGIIGTAVKPTDNVVAWGGIFCGALAFLGGLYQYLRHSK